MKTILLVFLTINGNPVGPTQVIDTVSKDCRLELSSIQGINATARSGEWLYASCEQVPAKR